MPRAWGWGESASRAINGDRWRKRRLHQPNDGDEGYAAAVGGGLQWQIVTASACLVSITTLRIRSPAD